MNRLPVAFEFCRAVLRGHSIVVLILALGCAPTKNSARPPPASTAPQASPTASASFVSTRGAQFFRNDAPYYFAGTNLWYGANLASTPNGRTRLTRELDLMVERGITNLRVLGASEGPGQHNSVNPQFQPGKAQRNEQLLQGLDFLLAEMSKRDMTAVIYLNNFWIWSGGMSQYVSWLTGEEVPNPFDKGTSWEQFMSFSARFYDSPEAQRLYRDFIDSLVQRKNTVTGRAYKEDPTILSWQLSNEPRPGSSTDASQNRSSFVQWVRGTSNFIRSIDSNHLISTGTEGLHGCNHSLDCYEAISSAPAIDYLNMHIWIFNWGWFDPKDMAATYPAALQQALAYMNQHADIATRLHKPITLEEFGAPRDGEAYSPESTTQFRDKYFAAMFDAIYQNASSGGPIAGSNFWAWGGEGRAANPAVAVWHSGDPLVGDPPQEPQGLNSIFSSDESTLAVVATHAAQMQQLTR